MKRSRSRPARRRRKPISLSEPAAASRFAQADLFKFTIVIQATMRSPAKAGGLGAFGCDGTCSYSIWLKHGVALSAVGLTQNRRASGPNTSSSLGRSCTMNRGLRKPAHFSSSWIRSRQRKIVLKPSIGGRVILSRRIRAQRRASHADKFEFENLARAYLRLAKQAERNGQTNIAVSSIGAAQNERSLRLGRSRRCDDQDYVRWCFAGIAAANEFKKAFGGKLIFSLS